ncbi:MAG: hypothetical protein ACOZQL_32845 [Myxococcota bacterium]
MFRTALLVGSLFATAALASSTYPTAIQTKLSLGAPPSQSCALCHTNGITGAGTVNTPFGTAMRGKGLTGGDNTTALNTALDQLAAQMIDSDSDGTTDVAELMAGRNPNVADGATDGGMGGGAGGGGGEGPPTLKYGCGATVVPELLLLAGLVPLLRRRAR